MAPTAELMSIEWTDLVRGARVCVSLRLVSGPSALVRFASCELAAIFCALILEPVDHVLFLRFPPMALLSVADFVFI